ncbi:MAG: PadR family transcriptional regulator, partial [Sphingopyxis sp.]
HGDFGRGFGGGGFGGGADGRGGPMRGQGRGGRRGKRFAGEELRLLLLALLRDAPQHGYQLIQTFAERSGGVYAPSPGMLYPLLTMLEDQGHIAQVVDAGGGARRSFAVTDAGHGELAAQQELVTALVEKLAALAGTDAAGAAHDAAPVRRALHNLETALHQRFARARAAMASTDGAATDERAPDGAAAAMDILGFDIAAILDDAAQKIERL